MTPQAKDLKYGPVVLECVSKSNPSREPYRVRCLEGFYSCNCKGWIFNRDRPKHCKHTDKAQQLDKEWNEILRGERTETTTRLTTAINDDRKSSLKQAGPVKLGLESVIAQAILVKLEGQYLRGNHLSLIAEIIRQHLPTVAELAKPINKVSETLVTVAKVRRIVFDD